MLLKYKYVIILVLFVFIIKGNVYADTEFQIQSEDWSELANQVLTLAKQKDYDQARVILKQLGDQFVRSNLAEKNLTLDAVHQLSSAIINVQGSLDRLTPHDQEILMAVTKLALAFDAISHSKQPQWKGYYNSLLDKVNSIQDAAVKGDKRRIVQKIREFNSEYSLLRAALVVAKSPSTVNHFDSLLHFMQDAKPKEIKSNIGELKQLLKNIFQGSEKDVLAMFHPLKHLPIVIPVFWIIGFIVAVLGIVSWRKHVSFTQR